MKLNFSISNLNLNLKLSLIFSLNSTFSLIFKGLFILGVALKPFAAWAAEAKHRHHEAHVHGAATLQIAFDQLQGKIEFKGASEGLVGFEHKARSEADRAQLANTLTQFESNLSKMIQFDSALKCLFTKESLGLVPEASGSQHSNIIGYFKVSCKQTLLGSKLVIDFTAFQNLHEVEVTVLVDDLQKTAEVKTKPVTLELK